MNRWLEVPPAIAIPAAIALLVELFFYFTQPRKRWPQWFLIASSVAPYLIYSIPGGVFDWRSALIIPAAIAVPLFWFRLPPSRWTDVGFVLLMAAPLVFKLIAPVYARPHERVQLEVLGHLAWIRAGVTAILRDRQQAGIGFGFWPKAAEWRTGAIVYAAFVPAGFGLGMLVGFVEFRWPVQDWWIVALTAVATFLGVLWVVALSEELFFRGLLQQWIEEWTGTAWAGLLLASLAFGAVHLGFRAFPNWRFALLAAVAGVFYGIAFRKSGGIRAAMVAHALVVTTWKVLFR